MDLNLWLPEIGPLCLISSLGFTLLTCQASRQKIHTWVFWQSFFVFTSFVLLGFLLYQCDLSVLYVAHQVHHELPWYYRLSALWGGHEGSLLLWLLCLTFWIVLFSYKTAHIKDKLYQDTLKIASVFQALMILFVLTTSNPFLRALPIPPEFGSDLNPVLQDIGLIVHPPILYLGYVGFALPCAFMMALLFGGRANASKPWAAMITPWAFGALSFLTLGITLGSWWAYYELGWGGWWFWDPVENASFMPWLLGLAWVHLLYNHRKRQAYTALTVLLGILTYGFCLLGTFLVRSGIITSVHSFSNDPQRGLGILIVLGLVLGSGLGLYAYRISDLQPSIVNDNKKSAWILLGACLLIGATAVVLLGTLYPLCLEAFWGKTLSVGPPYFNQSFLPFMIPIGLLCAWVPTLSTSDLIRSSVFSGLVSLTIVYTQFGRHPVLCFLGMWLAGIIILQSYMAYKKGKKWSMVLSHAGLGVLITGIALTMHLDQELDVALKVGDSVILSDKEFTLLSFNNEENNQYSRVIASVSVKNLSHPDRKIVILKPEKRYFKVRNMALTETAIHPGLWVDDYVALAEPLEGGAWAFRIYVKPFVRWIWMGALMMMTGCILAVFRRR